jgi:phosphonoacetate hydrolase
MNGQKILVAMMDGFGLDYFNKGDMPTLRRLADEGFFREVKSMFPSVTNVNNVSIATGEWPAVHGISANSRFDPETGTAVYLNEGVKCDSVFTRAKKAGARTALLSSKKKTKELFGKEVDIVIAAEDLSLEQKAKYGEASGVYTREINYWLWDTAEKIIAEDAADFVYVHITDYPMHMWAPDHKESREHLSAIDAILARIVAANPGIAVFATADHGMNFKKRCWDLTKALESRGIPARFVLSPERDYYIKHHRNFTGCAWLWLNGESSRPKTKAALLSLAGVESVTDSKDVAFRYNLDASAMGDLVVFGDKDTMFGDMESEYEDLPAEYRAHGSLHETDLPLLIWNYEGDIGKPDEYTHNRDLCRKLF